VTPGPERGSRPDAEQEHPPDAPPTVEVPQLESPTVQVPAVQRPAQAPPPAPTPAPTSDVPEVDDSPTIAVPALQRLWQEAERNRAASGDDDLTEPQARREQPDDVAATEPDQPSTAAPASGGTGGSTGGAGAVGLGRASGIMALGTLASRVTGFLRTVAITAAIGTALVGDAYNVANTTPNILYDLLLGGVLTSVVVPVLARAAREDDDGGTAFASSLLTLVVLGLTVITVLGLLVAPLIVKIYISRPDQAELATTFLRYFLPQVIFYGVGATIGAILNLRNRFAAPMATPVLNNLIVIATCVVFMMTADIDPDRVDSITGGEVALLGAGTTLGIVVMTVALLPSLRASGFRYRPRLDLRHPGLRSASRLAAWVLVFVVTSQVSYFVVTRLATGGVAYTTWFNAYQLFQLPHAIIAVSVITALLPRMSRHAAEERLDLVRGDLSTGLRLAAVVIVPAALGLLVLATPISVAIFAHGATSVSDAGRIGAALAAFAFALVPFSTFQIQLRAFYALADSRTPALVNFAVAGTNIVAALLLSAVLPDRHRAVALALAFAAAYLVGAAVCTRLLVHRLGGIDRDRLLHTLGRTALAGAAAAVVALLLSRGVLAVLGTGSAGSLGAVVLAGIVGALAYLLVALRMRIEELSSLTAMVRSRLGR
jgi:putative peptidoglycan lipid II flippase